MINWHKLRDTSGTLILLSLASEMGMSLDDCLAGTQIVSDELENPLSSIFVWQELAVLRNIQAFRGNEEQLGLMVSRRCTASGLGVFGQALATSETLKQAWELMERFQLLGLGFSRFEFCADDKQLSLTIHDFEMPSDCQRFCEERGLGACLCLFSDLVGHPLLAKSVSMRLPAPSDQNAYHDFFGVEVQFNAPETSIVFDRAIENSPLPNANRKLQLASIRYCNEAIESQIFSTTFESRVTAILEAQNLSSNLEDAAQLLSISSRQLRRHLAKESTSFREILLNLKFARARARLNSGVSVNKLAQELGYASQASFSRAFKKHTGKPPSFSR